MATVRINPRLEAEVTGHLASHGPLEAVLGEIASQIAANARQLARAEFYATGAYARSIHAEHGLDKYGQLVGRVVATNYKSHWAEFGWRRRTGGTRARHILRRAAIRAGFDVLTADLAGGRPITARPQRTIGAAGRLAIGARPGR